MNNTWLALQASILEILASIPDDTHVIIHEGRDPLRPYAPFQLIIGPRDVIVYGYHPDPNADEGV
jgi:hypothetical protein